MDEGRGEKPRGKGDVHFITREVEAVKKLIIVLIIALALTGCGAEKAYESSGIVERI